MLSLYNVRYRMQTSEQWTKSEPGELRSTVIRASSPLNAAFELAFLCGDCDPCQVDILSVRKTKGRGKL